jgi:hypothetical protein
MGDEHNGVYGKNEQQSQRACGPQQSVNIIH